ncbi:MAG: MBOAT family protein [Acetobacteraceae bacterium]|nr:MBOAT family protein [Acetobacteraceae bacterium]MBV8591122.1 MBOAT family protein [Acetobacteraceae bacterium]
MLFYEPLFLFLFLPLVYLLYLLVERQFRLRAAVILLASVFFYAWSEPLFVPVVLLSGALDHALGLRLARAPRQSRRAHTLLAIGVVANIGILIHYKYTRFLIENIDSLLHGLAIPPLTVPQIALPIGVSFIVFEKITYLVDIQRGLSRPAPSFTRYLLYVFFFPKLLAGPIIKYHEMEAQIETLPAANFDDFAAGFLRFMLGVVKKTLLADTLATGADSVFNDRTGFVGFGDAWWGVILFTFQIYFDFSAYSDMAIGIARMLGFRLRENFNMPYISCSITEFWHRWHISLSTWIREYLYIPLGGNRVGVARQYLNLWICFLASGIWHGAAWTYVIWGAYNGLFLALDKLFLLRVLRWVPPLVANAFTFFVVMVGWVLFRAHSLDQAGEFFHAMLHPGLIGTTTQIYITTDIKTAAVVAAIICAIPRLPGWPWLRDQALRPEWRAFAVQMALAALFVGAVGKAVADPFKPFLYFRF